MTGAPSGASPATPSSTAGSRCATVGSSSAPARPSSGRASAPRVVAVAADELGVDPSADRRRRPGDRDVAERAHHGRQRVHRAERDGGPAGVRPRPAGAARPSRRPASASRPTSCRAATGGATRRRSGGVVLGARRRRRLRRDRRRPGADAAGRRAALDRGRPAPRRPARQGRAASRSSSTTSRRGVATPASCVRAGSSTRSPSPPTRRAGRRRAGDELGVAVDVVVDGSFVAVVADREGDAVLAAEVIAERLRWRRAARRRRVRRPTPTTWSASVESSMLVVDGTATDERARPAARARRRGDGGRRPLHQAVPAARLDRAVGGGRPVRRRTARDLDAQPGRRAAAPGGRRGARPAGRRGRRCATSTAPAATATTAPTTPRSTPRWSRSTAPGRR